MVAVMKLSTIQEPSMEAGAQASPLERVMTVLRGVRATKANGEAYGADAALGEVGFTSLEMVNVMLAVETAFDLMIPAKDVTPANFRSGASIAVLIEKLLPAA